jgi:serine/threonine protein kinase/tetratricopeptide (TPR) repeat protein
MIRWPIEHRRIVGNLVVLTSLSGGAKLTFAVTLAPGTRLGPYRIVEPLGSGGMGVVYRARDTRLGRDVALKVLSEKLAGHPDALGRFEREARIVASLSHPNILALYDVGTDGSMVYAITELLEGESLDRRISRESMSWRQGVEIGAAIADGLSSAHGRGIVHRDLKPANVFITRDGVVKILDFGLATPARTTTSESTEGLTALPPTEPGTILGTVGYMSPEQVRGEPTDHRSDLFALGCILTEMLTGRRAFGGNTAAETLAAILRDEPTALAESARQIPPNVEAVVRRCLEKDREQRFQSARDLAFAQRGLLSGSVAASAVPSPAPKSAHRFGTLITATVIVAALTVLVTAGWRTWSAASRRIESVAVLPLANRSGDAAEDYFADGLTDQLIAELARIDSIRVTSRTSAMTYKGSRKPLPQIARELGVDAVLEGSVTRRGSRMVLTADLVDASTDTQLWSDTYERDVHDVLRLQGEIAEQVARRISVELSPEDRAQLQGGRQVDPAAFDAYVRGRYYWNKRGPADLQRAVEEFRRAIDVDPTYGAAYAGLADAYAQIGYQNLVPPKDAFPKAKAAATQAITLAPDLAEPHASLGFVHMYFDWDFAASENEFKRAITLDPNSVTAHHGYSVLLAAILRPDEARQEIERARLLDPLSPLVATDAGFETYYDRRYDAAEAALKEAIAANPKGPVAHFWLARTYQARGRNEAALAAYQAAGDGVATSWPTAMSGLGHLYAQMGRKADALKILERFDAMSTKSFVSAYGRALVYLGLGDRQQTFAWLQRAYDERSNWMVWLLKDPRWDPMRGDPRFKEMIERIGFPPDARARTIQPAT